jgi:aminopeptidase N
VTCASFFDLTLKEGLTVYRDQEFSCDMNSRAVKRIEDVLRLRTAQFAEDGGPNAHAVRPEAVAKMDNLYTSTVYEKGAEVVRLYETVLGAGGFRAGMDLYFKRHDGSAVTCDDFYAAMADANAGAAGAAALPALKRWYAQAGTPAVTVTPAYDASARTLTLRCAQRTPATPGAPAESKVPVLIPIAAGLLSADGAPLPVTVAGGAPGSGSHTATLLLADAAADFVLTGVPPGAVPSLPRPVHYSSPAEEVREGWAASRWRPRRLQTGSTGRRRSGLRA